MCFPPLGTQSMHLKEKMCPGQCEHSPAIIVVPSPRTITSGLCCQNCQGRLTGIRGGYTAAERSMRKAMILTGILLLACFACLVMTKGICMEEERKYRQGIWGGFQSYLHNHKQSMSISEKTHKENLT